MRFSEMTVGDYVVRTRAQGWARVLAGAICYVVDVKPDSIKVQRTEECVPVGTVYQIPVEGDDNYWYDISALAMAANSCIAPSIESISYPTSVSISYKNFIDLSGVTPLHGAEAIGRICLIGQQDKNKLLLSREGYYVIDIDSMGYSICYSGYCQPDDVKHKEPSKLVVLNLLAAARSFYPAEEIVKRCVAAYNEDSAIAQTFANRMDAQTSVQSTSYDDI